MRLGGSATLATPSYELRPTAAGQQASAEADADRRTAGSSEAALGPPKEVLAMPGRRRSLGCKLSSTTTAARNIASSHASIYQGGSSTAGRTRAAP